MRLSGELSGEYVVDEGTSLVGEEVVEEAEKALLFEGLGRLPERARRILLRRYGLDGGEPATLRELSEELGVSCERIRQLQREAERRLRSSVMAVTPAESRRERPLDSGPHDLDRSAGREAQRLGRLTA